MSNLPKRDAKQLIESLRRRAAALTGQSWERTANRDMMNEAAQMLEDLTAPASLRPAPEVKHSVLAHKYNDRNSCEACHLFWCMSRNQADGVFEPYECTCDLIPLASPAPPKEPR
jgi:hypothetical protein